MGFKRVVWVSDLDRYGLDLYVECHCGRKTVLSSRDVEARCKGRSHDIYRVAARLRCAHCGRRPKYWGSWIRGLPPPGS